MLDQGWRVRKTLTRVCVEPRDKAGRKGRGGGEQEEYFHDDFPSPFHSNTSNQTEFFSLYYWMLWGKKNLPCHTKEEGNNYFSCLNTRDYISPLFLLCLININLCFVFLGELPGPQFLLHKSKGAIVHFCTLRKSPVIVRGTKICSVTFPWFTWKKKKSVSCVRKGLIAQVRRINLDKHK